MLARIAKYFYMDSICPCACARMKIKNTKLSMKNNKAAKARLRGARAVCFDGKFIGYTEKTFRELTARLSSKRRRKESLIKALFARKFETPYVVSYKNELVKIKLRLGIVEI